MNIEFSKFLIFQLGADILFFVAAIWFAYHMKRYHRMVQIMTANSPDVATDPELIEEWFQQYENLPVNSPKWQAYKKRLIEIGRIERGD